jgi:hypothetical protein
MVVCEQRLVRATIAQEGDYTAMCSGAALQQNLVTLLVRSTIVALTYRGHHTINARNLSTAQFTAQDDVHASPKSHQSKARSTAWAV